MPTTYTYSVTRDDIIKAALRAAGIIGRTQLPTAGDYTYAMQAMNIMIKFWHTKGLFLWKISEITVALLANTRTYILGTGGATGNTIRPMRVLDQGNFIRVTATTKDTPIQLLGRSDYEQYGSKLSLGIPNSIWYDPQLNAGVLSVYPVPTDATRELHLFCQLPFADVVTAADSPDFSQECFQLLKYGLARELIVEYGCDVETERRINERYEEALPDNLNFSVDEASTYFTVDTRGR